MSKKTKEVAAVEGNVEYDTYECFNCESDYLEEDVMPVFVDVKTSKSGSHARNSDCKNIRKGKSVNVCENCAGVLFNYQKHRYDPIVQSTKDWVRGKDPMTIVGGIAIFVYMLVMFLILLF